ncbi:MAG: gluconokinase [Candidatus Dormibacter sp.]|uniref:gluconokinase n=1 Tax=Candidatus Dormibacter sp. TaxID=2973982 RepID=UPI000DB8C1AF|nr:MAG: carbohydrate kinase [Candidatus Dormibacteraeota bacterium]
MAAGSGRNLFVLSLDVGTSSVRAMGFDGRGRELPGLETKLEYTPRAGADGTAEVDADRVAALVESALDQTLERAGKQAAPAALGISTFWHGLQGLDRERRPTTPIVLWSDTRSWRQAERLRRDLDGEAVRRRTGCPLHPSYWPAKLAWLRQAGGGAWGRTRHWVSIGDYLFLRWFGELTTSASMASGTGLRKLAGGLDEELLQKLRLSPERVPEEAEVLSGLKPDYRRRWPQLAEVPFLTARGDGALANLGSGCTEPSVRALTIGTSGALRVMTDRRPRHLAKGLWCYLLDERRFVVGGALSNGGNLWAWMESNLRLEQEGLEDHLARLEPASGPDFLTLLAGERSPGFALHATGSLARLTQATTAYHIARSGLEAVALQFAQVDRALDRTVPGAKTLVASGGALHASPLWSQIMADAVGKPVSVSESFEASSHGAALLALQHLGQKPALDTRRGKLYEPDAKIHDVYRQAARRQARLYKLLVESAPPAAAAPAHA